MKDAYRNHATGLESPALRHFPVSPSDTDDLPERPRALVALSDGTVALRDRAGVDVTYPVLAGTILPIRAVRVLASGTTAAIAAWC